MSRTKAILLNQIQIMNDISKAIQEYENLRYLILGNDFAVSDYKQINYGLQFSIGKLEWSGIIRVYQNNQGKVKIDFSQLDNSENSVLIKRLTGNQPSDLPQTVKSNDFDGVVLPVIGSDESGKGDYFGSLVIACVYVDEFISQKLFDLGVKDSKSISDTRILEIAKRIRYICKDKFIVLEISAERYNQIYAKLENEKKSLNDLLAWAHAKAIEEILSKVECQTAIVDQFADEHLLLEKLQEQGKKIQIIQVPRAESNIAVAAASILARERFINKLDKLGKQYQTKIPKGASQEVIKVARLLVEKNGNEILKKIAKFHFKTTKEILA